MGVKLRISGWFDFATRNYLVLTLTSALWNIGFSITETYFSLYIFKLGGTETTIGLITALGSAGYLFSMIVGGQIADMYGRKRLLGFMTVVGGLSHLLLAIAPDWRFLLPSWIIVNLCWVAEPAFWAMLADSTSVERRGVAFSVYSCLNLLPWSVMPYVGGYLIDTLGVLTMMRWVYVALAVIGVIIGLIRLSMLSETMTPPRSGEELRVGFRSVCRVVKTALREHLKLWKSMPSSVLALAVTYMLWSFEFGLVEPYWIVYAEEEIGLTSSEWGTVIAVGNVVGLAFKLFAVGRILDRFHRKRVLLTILMLDSTTYILFIMCRSFHHVITLWIYASLIWAFYGAAYPAIEADLIPKERRGRTFAALGAAWSAFSIPSSLIGGVVYERVNPRISFVSASLVVILCLVITARFLQVPEGSPAGESDLDDGIGVAAP
ncbi:hypothetical protein DRO55_03250 [Candidatus Bathyarchaeota archaeon]|nr:MAG: hypothetical protein DRO55_03250 [Candidatus Bathyarchaeota archaeon]